MAVTFSAVNGIFFISVIIFMLGNSWQWAIDDDGCRTPGRGAGNCIPIYQCSTLQSMVITNTGLSMDKANLLKRYQCGFYGNSVKVCCPKEAIPAEPVTFRFSTDEDPPAPDVSKHRNINLLPYDCGSSQSEERISGGNITFFGEFPWMVLLSYSTASGSSYKCGGTIINNKYILTAAHCITNLTDMRLVGVRVGEHNISSRLDCDGSGNDLHCAPPVQDIPIEEILPHPEFNPAEFMHDVGLLRLAARINISVETAKPICLPSTKELRNTNFTEKKLTATGWGITEEGRTSEVLLKVDIPIISRTECQKTYQKSTAKISHLHLCGGGKDKHDSCGGDSGGPLQRIVSYNSDARYVQYGIVSFGARTCGKVGAPGVYTRVDYYMDWILNTIRP